MITATQSQRSVVASVNGSYHYAGLPLLLLLTAVALGWNLSGYPLLDPDDGRNAEVAREIARTAIFDSTLTLCTTAAILCFFAERPTPAWAAMGVGALTKGPIAVAIPLLALVPYALATGTSPRRLFPGRGLGVFLLIALPWF